MADSAQGEFSLAYLIPADLTETTLRQDIIAVWNADSPKNPWALAALKEQGIPAGTSPFAVDWDQGADPFTAVFLIALAPGAAKLSVKVATDIWNKIILPQLERKYGIGKIRRKGSR